MTWKAISEEDLRFLISAAEVQMSNPERALWQLIAIEPRKWVQSPWGDQGGGFWVVAISGSRCLYYNDIEDGFNWSRFSQYGSIDEYHCNQNELSDELSYLFTSINRA
jgi:hypothetical protein